MKRKIKTDSVLLSSEKLVRLLVDRRGEEMIKQAELCSKFLRLLFAQFLITVEDRRHLWRLVFSPAQAGQLQQIVSGPPPVVFWIQISVQSVLVFHLSHNKKFIRFLISQLVPIAFYSVPESHWKECGFVFTSSSPISTCTQPHCQHWADRLFSLLDSEQPEHLGLCSFQLLFTTRCMKTSRKWKSYALISLIQRYAPTELNKNWFYVTPKSIKNNLCLFSF